MPPHTSTESSRFTAPKLRRALPMFNFEHRFESLSPTTPWLTAARDGALWRLSPEAWQEVLDTNVTGAFNCIQAVAGSMRAQRYGKIVNVASHQAFRPGFGIANYAASKAALIGLTRSAAVDLGPSNVNVNAVAPGFVKTDLLSKLPREVLERAE